MAQGRIALVGDFNADVIAHRAIEACFALHRQTTEVLGHFWLATENIVPGDDRALQASSGIWCVPASPYRNTEGALWAIRYARTHSLAFLGTCGGYQHALLEFARNVLGLRDAGHTETHPDAKMPLLHRMACPIIEESQQIIAIDDQLRSFYGCGSGPEGYHCSYGLNPDYENLFSGTPLKIAARTEDGQARAFRLDGHPFFIGTQFQPERRSLSGSIHPLVRAFFAAAVA